MTNLTEFLKTGRLETIAVGMSREEVKAVLGEPQDASVHKYPLIWKYGGLQLIFDRAPDDSRLFLASITLYFHEEAENIPEAFAPIDWVPTAGTTFQVFRAHLDENEIRVFGGVTSGPHKHLVLESGVRITFDDDRLYSIGYTMKRESDTKQLTIKVRRKALEMIEKWAKGRGISISDLCSEWIKEHVSHLETPQIPDPVRARQD
jgi:hypothetical protein